MLVLCINGKRTKSKVELPEFVPLTVRQSDKFESAYVVKGYEFDEDRNIRLHWKKERFVPITTVVKEPQEVQLEEVS